jgi:RNA-directed DNA polymerase
VVRLQKTLISSYSARLLATRRVTQDNQGKATAGVDGKTVLNSSERLELAENLKLDGKATPLKRVKIPQPGKKEQRSLGIPTIEDRAKQALAKLALEPQWEAKFEPNTYGFRPGRSCHDAIEAIELSIRRKAKYVLDADLKGCFDNIDHNTLISKLETYPIMEQQIRAWLKSGVMKGDVFHKTTSGTPQGSIISPLLANIALHGFENYISKEFPRIKTRKGQPKGKMLEMSEARAIRYADDFVILHEKLETIRAIKAKTEKWIKGIGLKLNESNTRITHTLHPVEDEKPGFDFLGFHIQSYEVGKTKCGKQANGERLMMRTRVRPSDDSIRKFRTQVKDILKAGFALTPPEMIQKLNWYVRGWANYFKTGDSSHITFAKLQNDMYSLYLAWGRKKFSQRGDGYVVSKLFHQSKHSSWNFGWKEGEKVHLAVTLYEFRYRKHTKIKGDRSPYDGDWVYWVKRRGRHPLCPKDIQVGIQKQDGKCYYCNQPFWIEDQIEIHHIDGNRKHNQHTNKVIVHRYCHDKIHQDARSVEKTPHLA